MEPVEVSSRSSGRSPASDLGQITTSSQTHWRHFSRDLSDHVKTELRKDSKWKRVLDAVQEASGGDVSLALIERTFDWIGKMPVALIRAIDSDRGWTALAAIAHRVDQEEYRYFVAGKGLELNKEMLLAVHKEEKGAEVKLLKTMASFDGDPEYLRRFLDIVGSYSRNPYAAIRGVEVRNAGESDMPTFAPTAGEAVNAGGHVVENHVRLFHPTREASSFVVGYQAGLKIAEAFDPERFDNTARTKTRRERSETSNHYLRNLSIEDLLEHPEKAGGSRLLVRSLEVYQALQAEIKSLRGEVADKLVGDALTTFNTAMSEIRSYSGGKMMSWMREHISDDTVPADVRSAFKALDDPFLTQNKKEHRENLQTVSDYYLAHVAKIGRSAVQPLLDDVRVYEELKRDKPELLKELGIPADVNTAERLGKVAHLLDRPELGFQDVAAISVQLGVALSLREALGKRDLEKYRTSVDEAIAIARRLFQEPPANGETASKWRADSLGKSVPLDRLTSETVEAAKIGFRATGSQRERVALFSRDDLAALQELLRLKTFAPTDGQMVRANSSTEFHDLIVHTTIAARRASDFYKQLEAAHISPEARFTKSEIDALKKMEHPPTILYNKEYKPKEEFDTARFKRPLAALLEAGEDLKSLHMYQWSEWARALPMLHREANAGLLGEIRPLTLISGVLREFTLRDSLPAGVIDDARKVIGSPHCKQYSASVVDLKPMQIPSLDRKYLRLSEVESAKQLAGLWKVIEPMDLVKMDELKKGLDPWNRREVIGGEFGKNPKKQVRSIELRKVSSITQFANGENGELVCTLVPDHDFSRPFARVFTLEQMTAETKARAEAYTAVAALPAEQIAKFKSTLASGLLDTPHGRMPLSHTERELLSDLVSGRKPDLWIAQETLVSLNQALAPAPKLKDGVLVPRALDLKGGEPVITFNNPNQGKSLFEIKMSFLLWISNTYSKLDARPIAAEVYRIRMSGARDGKDQFARWLEPRYPNLIAK